MNLGGGKKQFKVAGSLRWEMLDHYGYPIRLDQIRNARIDNVLSNRQEDNYQEDIRYSLSLTKTDEDGWGGYNLDWYKGKLSLYSLADDDGQSYLRIKLNCNDFIVAESLVKLLMVSNSLELMPACKADFITR